MNLHLGIDVDGVLYPFHSVIARWIEKNRGMRPGVLDDIPLSWAWYRNQWGLDSDEFLEHYASGVRAGVVFSHGDPLPGSLHTIRRLADAGHKITYVSARAIPGISPNLAWTKTATWLRQHGFPHHARVVISDDKAAIPTDVFLDDAPHNIEALTAAGHEYPLLWDAPYNQDAKVPHRVRSWAGFVRVVETLADDLVMRRAA